MPTADGEAWVTFAKLLADRAAAGGPGREIPPLSFIGFTGPPNTIPRISFRRLLLPGAEHDPRIQEPQGQGGHRGL